MQVRPFSPSFGIFLHREGPSESLLDLDTEWIKRMIEEKGLIFIRGFEPDVTAFEDLSKRVCPHFMSPPYPNTREKVPGDEYTYGGLTANRIHLYAVLHHLPWQPDIVWFMRRNEAEEGGRTGYFLASDIYNALSEKTKAIFATNRLLYKGSLAKKWIIKFKPDYHSPVDALRSASGVIRANSEGDQVFYEYVADAIATDPITKQTALLEDVQHELEFGRPLGRSVSFENGDAIPDAILEEINTVTEKLFCGPVFAAGDIIILNNRRVVHARKPHKGKISTCIRLGLKGA